MPDTVFTRDPIGEQTLYYAPTSEGAKISPRLRELRPYAEGLNLEALRDYLACAFVPGARTLYGNVFELRPGESLNAVTGERVPGPDVSEGAWSDGDSLAEHAARLRPLLEKAVAERLPPSGEPVGVYLSGGLDSSLITALVCRLHDGPVHTFSLHFGPDTPSELEWSGLVAARCGTRHHVLGFDAKTIWKHLPETIAALDDPIGDPLTVPNLLLGKAARAEGIRTVFNGEGGDPVFGGPKNLPMVLHSLYDGGESDASAAYFRSYQKCYDDLPRLLKREVREKLDVCPEQAQLLEPYLGPNSPMKSYLNQLMHLNLRLKGADQILTKVSNLTGACGLTAASPLFDPDVVEAGFAIPARYKLDGAREKAVLKEAVKDLVPDVILSRPKSGMMVPVQKWFKIDLQKPARALLLNKKARIAPYLEQSVIKEWLEYKSLPFHRHGVRIWLLVTLELWMRENSL